MRILNVLLFVLANSFLSIAQEQFVVYFDSNKSETNKVETKKLQDWIIANSEVKIVAINGYTDGDGSNGFNDTLAKKRVDFIFCKIGF